MSSPQQSPTEEHAPEEASAKAPELPPEVPKAPPRQLGMETEGLKELLGSDNAASGKQRKKSTASGKAIHFRTQQSDDMINVPPSDDDSSSSQTTHEEAERATPGQPHPGQPHPGLLHPDAASYNSKHGRHSKGSLKFATHADIYSPRLSNAQSMRSTKSRLSAQSSVSSVWDPWEGQENDEDLRDDLRDELEPLKPARKRRHTVFGQAHIARQVSLPFRMLGISLAFVTVIFLWETTDLSMLALFPKPEVRLIFYLLLFLTAGICLAFSHQWILSAHSSLVPSFAYSLSTLFMAMGGWGVVGTSVMITVPEHMRIFFFASGGCISLICTVLYALQTRHNVLLDIASCATTMGLHEDTNTMDMSDFDIDP